MENVNPLPPNYYNFEIKGLSDKAMGIGIFTREIKIEIQYYKEQTPDPDKVRVQPDTPSGRMLVAVPLNGGYSPLASDRCGSAEAVVLKKGAVFLQRSSDDVEKSSFPLESRWKKGYLSVPKSQFFILVRKVWLFPPG